MKLRGAEIRTMLGQLTSGLAELLLPRTCAACGGADVAAGGLCEDCNLQLLSMVSLNYCPRCGATLGPNIPARDDGCGACPTTLPRFERAIRLGPYAGPLRSVIRELKYRRREAMRRRLGVLLGEAISARCADRRFDVAIPVPMHWRRRLARGYDHARMLAGAVAGMLNLPVGDELIRIRHTPPQVNLPRSQRIRNVRGAFALTRRADLHGADILLLDDVTTTGATANEAARTLLAGGASHVTLAVVAKAEPPRAYSQQLE